ncbi:uncharacterized protein LOC144334618 [Macaca mulatta]
MGARVSPSPAVTGCGSFLRNRAASATGTAGGAPTGPWPALAPAHAWPLRRESRRPWPPPRAPYTTGSDKCCVSGQLSPSRRRGWPRTGPTAKGLAATQGERPAAFGLELCH